MTSMNLQSIRIKLVAIPTYSQYHASSKRFVILTTQMGKSPV